MNCKSPSLCLPPLNPLRLCTCSSFQVSLGWNMAHHNHECFFQFGGFKSLVFFFPILKQIFSKLHSFLVPKISLFRHHSAKYFLKRKKSTGHNVTRLAANQLIKHIQLKSIYQDESLTQACSPIKCATLVSNKMIRCNLDMQAPTIWPSCQEFGVLY